MIGHVSGDGGSMAKKNAYNNDSIKKLVGPDRVRDFVIGKTGLNPIAFKVLHIAEIPKNDAGKVLYKELQQYITG